MSIIRDDALSLQDEVVELESVTENEPNRLQQLHNDQNPTNFEQKSPGSSTPPYRPDQPLNEDYQNYPNWVVWASHTPLLAGTTGPLSLLISISGLADPWRQTVDAQGNSSYDPKPKWVIAATAIAVVMEITGNIALFLNFYGRLLSYKMAMTISLAAFCLKVIMLFGCIAAFRQIYPDPGAIFYSQGFWLTIASSILTTFTAILLLLNLLGHFKKYYQSFRLSVQQRLLMLQFMAFLAWVALGAATFGAIERLHFVQSLYFVDVSLLTVGFGDVTMTTTLGRALLIPYAFIGILLLGLVVASIRSVVLEDARERLVQRHVASIRARKEMLKKGKYTVSDGLMAVPAMGLSLHDQRVRYEQMRKEEQRVEKTRARISASASVGIFVIFWCSGAAIFSATEGWTYFEAFYFCFVSLVTIGYGDFAVSTDPGRSIFIVWSLLSIPMMTILISMVGDTFVGGVQDHIRAHLRQHRSHPQDLADEVREDEIHMTKTRELPEDTDQLLDLIQRELPEELLALSEKLIRYAGHVSEQKKTPKYAFNEYAEMVERTRVPVLQAYETNHTPEDLQFLRNYSLAVVRVTKELKEALDKLEYQNNGNNER